MDSNFASTDYCVKGCGSFSNPSFENKCFKCLQHDRQVKLEAEKKQSSPITHNESTVNEISKGKTKKHRIEDSLQPEHIDPEKTFQTVKSRCYECKGKVSLIKQKTNQCRCDFVFCDSHKFPEQHDCTFDFASAEKDDLARNNPRLHEKPRGGRNFNRTD